MLDSWDNLDCEDNPVSVVPSAERTKQLRERKLIEEADNALTRELFATGEVASADAKKTTTKKKKLGR
jgi:RNA polymerase-interacting CarD/CdnL/TRCF family regulator